MRRGHAVPLRYNPRSNTHRILRRCLRCEREFLAYGLYNRLCPKCVEWVRLLEEGEEPEGEEEGSDVNA